MSQRVRGVIAAAKLESVVVRACELDRPAAVQPGLVDIGRPAGYRDDHLVAVLERRRQRAGDRLRRAAAHDHLGAVVGEPVLPFELRAHRVLGLGRPVDVRITRIAPSRRLDRGVDHVIGRREAEVAGREVDHVDTPVVQLADPAAQLRGGRGADGVHAGRGHSHGQTVAVAQ